MKQTISMILTVSLLLSLFTGCSTTSAASAAEKNETVSTESNNSASTSSAEDGNAPSDNMLQIIPDGNDGTFPGEPPQWDGSSDGTFPGQPPQWDGSSDGSFPGQPPQGSGSSGGTFPGQPPQSNGSSNGTFPGQPPQGNGSSNGTFPGQPPQGNGSSNGSFPGQPPQGGGKPDGMPGGAPGSSSSNVSYSGAVEITSADAQKDQTYKSTASDENALLITTSDKVTVTNPTVTKTGDSDGGDNCNFYGLNAAVLVKDGANVTITGGTITSSASGANGVFCYGGNGGRNGASGDGTTVTISDTTITTTGSGSGGIMTTGGGVTYATNLTVTTSGQSSAPIRTDRGGGTVYVDDGVYTSNGLGSPAIYSTAEIHVANATLVSNLSEGVCIEGKNSIELTDCDLTANNTKCNGNATFLDTIMIYQSMSGDADSGVGSFKMAGGTLTSKSGHVFHVTNTNAVITLSGVSIVNEDSADVLLSVCADGWSGAGNIATLNASDQILEGTILVGSDSTLTLNLTDGSAFTGCISGSITNAKGTEISTSVGTVNVTLDAGSTWTLTGDTYITAFSGNAANIISNGYTLYVNGTALTGTN